MHLTRAEGWPGDPPEEAWIGRSENSRIPEVFPLGLRSEAPDPELRGFHDELLDITHPEPPRPLAENFIEIIERWPGDTLKPVDGGPVPVSIDELYLLHWMAGLTSDTTPRFELWVERKGPWTPPAATPDFGVKSKAATITAIGPVANTSGWHTWWTSRAAAKALGAFPDGSSIDLSCLPDQAERNDPESKAGMALYSGKVSGGKWLVGEASPRVSAETLQEALAFMRELLTNNRMQVRKGPERKAFDKAVEEYVFEEDSVTFKGDVATLGEPDERNQLMLAPSVFRIRFGGAWPADVEGDDE